MGVAEPTWMEVDVGLLAPPGEREFEDPRGGTVTGPPPPDPPQGNGQGPSATSADILVERSWEPDVDEVGNGSGLPTHSLLDLNAEQLEAVNARGPVMVEAPPGSGKTRTLAARVCRILQNASPQSVLAVTFTRYAAGEMREQVRKVVGDAADDVNITTFHSLGFGIVRGEADRLGLSKDVDVAGAAYARRLVAKAAKVAGVDERWDVDTLVREIERAKGDLLGPDEYRVFPNDFYSQTVAQVYRTYQELLHEKHLIDFGDMLRLAVRALRRIPETRMFYQRLYRYVLVDEWQDTNSAQYGLVRALVGRETDLFVVGDPVQSIYGWRGAHPGVFAELARDYPSVSHVQLRVNYRSTETIAEASDGVVRALGLPSRDIVAQGGAGDRVTVIRCDTERDEALRVAEEVLALVGAGKWTYNDCAVLVRTVRQARLIEQALLRKAIPYTLAGQRGFFDTRVVREMVAWLRLAADPFDEGALKAALNAPPRGLGQATRESLRGDAFRLTMEALLAAPRREDLGVKTRASVQSFLEVVDEVHAMRDLPPIDLLDHILDRTGYAAWMRKVAGGNGNGSGNGGNGALLGDMPEGGRSDVLGNLRRLLGEYRGENALGGFLQDVEGMQMVAGTAGEGSRGVFLGTIHAAKGLEWPIVLLPGLDDGVLPHAKSLLDRKRLEEEHRLFYVALTRAMHKVTLLGARYRTSVRGQVWDCRPSRFLGCLPAATVERA